MKPTPFTEVLANLKPSDGGFSATLPADWLQGRTAYGGLMAALGLQAVLQALPELPPVRSAQVAFIGPSGSHVDIEVSVLRKGRSMTFVQCDLRSEKGLATRCVFCFGAARPSRLGAIDLPPPQLRPPDELPEFLGFEGAPAFTRHYETRLVAGGRPGSGSRSASPLVWVRHREQKARGSMVALLALADMLPPAMLSTLDHLVPASSVNWHVDFLVADVPVDDGWRLLLSEAESAGEGYSSQRMVAWDRRGNPLLVSRQAVAIFDG